MKSIKTGLSIPPPPPPPPIVLTNQGFIVKHKKKPCMELFSKWRTWRFLLMAMFLMFGVAICQGQDETAAGQGLDTLINIPVVQNDTMDVKGAAIPNIITFQKIVNIDTIQVLVAYFSQAMEGSEKLIAWFPGYQVKTVITFKEFQGIVSEPVYDFYLSDWTPFNKSYILTWKRVSWK